MLDLLPGRPAASPTPSLVPPPRFRPVQGEVTNVNFLRETPPLLPGVMSQAQAAGLRYETKVRLAMQELEGAFQLGAWFGFKDEIGNRICQVDAIHHRGDQVIAFEIKRNHCLDAWWQLRFLYQPVLQAAYPEKKIRVVEVCKSFDPAVEIPERVFKLLSPQGTMEKDYFWVWRLEL